MPGLRRVGQTGLFRAKWTERILDEWVAALLKRRPELGPSLARQRELMRVALGEAEVAGFEKLLPIVPPLPDPDDAHVVAAAMEYGAEVIVTFNLEDFPGEVLGPLGLEAQQPDTFVRHLIDLHREAVGEMVEQMALAKARPPMSYDEVLEVLHRRGLVESVRELRRG